MCYNYIHIFVEGNSDALWSCTSLCTQTSLLFALFHMEIEDAACRLEFPEMGNFGIKPETQNAVTFSEVECPAGIFGLASSRQIDTSKLTVEVNSRHLVIAN